MVEKIRTKIYNLLRWSERWTKTDMVYLAKGGFWLTAGQVVSSLASFLLAIAFANLLPKETYGTYRYILSIAGILTIPTLSGLNTAVVQALARDYDGSLFPAWKAKIRWGLLSSLAGLITAGYYYTQGNNTLVICFLIASIFMPLMESFNLYASILGGKKEFKLSTKYTVLIQTTASLATIIVLLLSKNVILLILTYFISYTLLRSFYFWLSIKKIKPESPQDKETVPYGIHLSIINIFGIIASQIDKILIFHFLGAMDVAIYSIAQAPINQMRGLIKNIQPLALPKYANSQTTFDPKNYLKKIKIMLIALLTIIILYLILAPWLFQIFFPKYLISIKYSQLLALSLFSTIGMLNTAFLQARAAKKELYKISTIMPTFQILASLIGVQLYGIYGMAAAFTLSKILTFFYSTFITIRFQRRLAPATNKE